MRRREFALRGVRGRKVKRRTRRRSGCESVDEEEKRKEK